MNEVCVGISLLQRIGWLDGDGMRDGNSAAWLVF